MWGHPFQAGRCGPVGGAERMSAPPPLALPEAIEAFAKSGVDTKRLHA